MVNGKGQKEAGAMHLYINKDRKLHFHINGFGRLHGKTVINDGEEHVVALRYLKSQFKWFIFVDGKEDCRKVIA